MQQNSTEQLKSKRPARDWMWRRLEERECHRRPYRTWQPPEYIIGKCGFLVKRHAEYPVTPALDRFLERIATIGAEHDGTLCRVWNGGPKFRITEEYIATPQRFIYDHFHGPGFGDYRVISICRTFNCCAILHLRKVRRGVRSGRQIK